MDGRGFYPNLYNPYGYMPAQLQPVNSSQNYNTPLYPTAMNQMQNSTYNTSPPTTSDSDRSALSTPSPSTSSSSPGDTDAQTKAKKTYDKWSQGEQQLLVNLWAEKLEEIECKAKRTTENCKKKIRYLIDRYKIAKDWNKTQSGGHRRESLFFKEIDAVLGCHDVVQLPHVADAGTSALADEDPENESTENDNSTVRAERKKSKKRKRAEDNDEEERNTLKESFDGLKEQRDSMNKFMENFTRMQAEQSQTMNALVGALTGFLQKSTKDDSK